MSFLRVGIVGLGCLLFLTCGASTQTGTESEAPSNEAVKLLLGQVDQAMGQYEQLIRHQTMVFGNSDNAGVDRQLLELWKTLKAELSKDPQRFNSARGFDVVVTVDDASRNAVLIAKLAATEMLEQVRRGKGAANPEVLSKLMEEADACGSSLLKASDSAAGLYTSYLRWQDAIAKKTSAPAPGSKPVPKKAL